VVSLNFICCSMGSQYRCLRIPIECVQRTIYCMEKVGLNNIPMLRIESTLFLCPSASLAGHGSARNTDVIVM